MMESQNKTTSAKGCIFGAFFVLFCIIALIGTVVFYAASARTSHTEQVLRASEAQASLKDHTIKIDRSKITEFSPIEFGDQLTAEHFIAVAWSSDTTELAENLFIREIRGKKVEWMLKLEEIDDPEDSEILNATFNLPYQFFDTSSSRRSNSSGNSAIIRAKFSTDSIPDLAKLRKDQWVKVSGKLNHEGQNKTTIYAAEIVNPANSE